MKTKITAIAILLTVGMQLYAGSLWAKRNVSTPSPYTDEVARKVGDILTITIEETASIENKVENKLKNDNSSSASFDGGLGIVTKNPTTGKVNSNILPRMPGFELSTQSARAMNGSADFKDNRKFADEIAVVVEDIMPNGNLVVIGSRFREVAGDIQEIRVSGIIRPTDISFGNSVSSTKVANFQMVFTNKGQSATYNKPGWLNNIFNKVWPL
jgi:flagellar L-ring protein precursor FlgH